MHHQLFKDDVCGGVVERSSPTKSNRADLKDASPHSSSVFHFYFISLSIDLYLSQIEKWKIKSPFSLSFPFGWAWIMLTPLPLLVRRYRCAHRHHRRRLLLRPIPWSDPFRQRQRRPRAAVPSCLWDGDLSQFGLLQKSNQKPMPVTLEDPSCSRWMYHQRLLLNTRFLVRPFGRLGFETLLMAGCLSIYLKTTIIHS